jgi:F-type H+-transporting ATPase subunit gamma
LVKVEIVHLVFEANASEHSSRMIAMKNATDNAEDLQTSLTLALNKARQSSVTQELTEITSAKEALTNE